MGSRSRRDIFCLDNGAQPFQGAEEDRALSLLVFKVLPTETSPWEQEDRLLSTFAENIEHRSVVAIAADEDEALITIEIEENLLGDLHIKITLATEDGLRQLIAFMVGGHWNLLHGLPGRKLECH